MHSSRMRIGHSLTVCWSLLPGGVWCRGVVWCQGGSGAKGGSGSGGVYGARGVVWSRGIWYQGGSGARGVVWSQGVWYKGGVWFRGGSGARGYIPACTEADPPPVDRQMPVKILPWPNFVAAGKYNSVMEGANA